MNAKTMGIAAGVAAISAAIAAVVVTQSRQATAVKEYGEKVYPDLGAKADNVASIVVNNAGTVSTVEKKGTAWVLQEKGGYPVKLEKVKEVVLGLAQLKQMEPKTSKPERYAEIGVEDPPAQPVAPPVPDPSKPEAAIPEKSQAALVTLKDASGNPIVSAIVGKQRMTNPPAIFVRKAGEAQSWLAEGQIDLPREVNQWLDIQVMNLARDRVKSVSITPGRADGSALVVDREKKEDTNFKVEGLADGQVLKDPNGGNGAGGALGYLNFDDVAQASAVGIPDGVTPTVYEARTFDGMVVTVKVFEKDGKYWGSFAASVDESALPKAPETPPVVVAPPVDPNKPADAQPDPAKIAADEAKRLADEASAKAEAVKKEVKDFNDRHGGWVYAIPEFKAKTMVVKVEELLDTKVVPGGPAGPGVGDEPEQPSPIPTSVDPVPSDPAPSEPAPSEPAPEPK